MKELKPLTTLKRTTDILHKLVEEEHWSAEDAMFFLNTIPDADVAPKSEVEKEVVEYIERHLQYQRKKVDIPFKSRDMRNYQCGAIDVIEYFEEWVAELKKKHTKRCTDCKHFVGCECFSGMTCDEYTEEKE